MVGVLCFIFAAALLAPRMLRAVPHAGAWLLAVAPAAAFGFLLVPGAIDASQHLSWVPALGVDLSLRLDGLSRLLALLVTGVGALVLVYTGGYLSGHPRQGRLLAYLLVFMGAMLGIAFADNLLALFVFWELTSISSFFLIGFDDDRAPARAAALQALYVTAGGGLALLAGVLLLAQAAGTHTISELAAERGAIVAHPLYTPALVLILLGAFTKSAQVPFHFWLPNAMEAPTPVSAYLHSSTMVKAGVFLLARLHPALGDTSLWIGAVGGIGALTAITGAVLAYRQTDLKRVLAYSTVSALGLMTLLLGIGTHAALRAALLVLLAHAMYKGALFLASGTVAHETGERDVRYLSGLRRAMPLTATAAAAAALSMAGVPPLGGFLAKELMLEAVLAGRGLLLAGAAAVVVTSMFLTAVAITVGFRPFFGARREQPVSVHEGSAALWLGSLLLAIGGAVSGLAPEVFASSLVDDAAQAIGVNTPLARLHLWHGITPALLLGALSLAGGGLLAWRWRAPVREMAFPGPESAYAAMLRGLTAGAAAQTRVLQTGYLRHYLLVTIAVTVALVGTTAALFAGSAPTLSGGPIAVHEAVLLLLILLSTAAAIRSYSRLGAVAALGVVGYSVALLYISFGAPDLAMTQFAIETLTVVLFLLALRNLPSAHFRLTDSGRWRDAALAIAGGLLMTGLVLFSTSAVHPAPVSGFFLERSLPDAHGRNVVNVILVDFRALDTLGEISVLALAGIGVYALLRVRPEPEGVRR